MEGIAWKKRKRQTFIFFIWSISQNGKKKKKKKKEKKERDKRSWLTTTRFQVGEFAKIVLQVLVLLTSRDRTPFFCRGFVSAIYFLLMFHDNKLTPL